MKTFEYLQPGDLAELLRILEVPEGRRRLIAGGTDLLPEMKKGLVTPPCLVSLGKIQELNFIQVDHDTLKIGAATPLARIEKSEMVKNRWRPLADAAGKIGSVQIRNRGTLGGNLCHGSPAADTAPILIGLGARLRILRPGGERMEDLENFFRGPGQTSLTGDEVLAEVWVPGMPPETGAVYLKWGPRKAMDIALVGVACLIHLSRENPKVQAAKIVLGAVAPVPLRAVRCEDFLRGIEVQMETAAKAGEIAAGECQPISDIRSSAQYRREMVSVLVKRAVLQAAAGAASART